MFCVRELLLSLRWFFFWYITNELCLLLTSGESLCVTNSGHISAAVEEDMTVVILLSVNREGLETHKHTHKHIYTHLVTITVLK